MIDWVVVIVFVVGLILGGAAVGAVEWRERWDDDAD